MKNHLIKTMKNHLIKTMFEPQGSDEQHMWVQLYYEEKEFENLKCYDEDRFTIDYELKI